MNANFGKAHGGIGIDNLSPALASLIPDKVTALHDSAGAHIQVSEALGVRPGVRASNMVYLPGNVVDGDTLTIGADVFEVDIINTDSAVNTVNTAAGALNNTSDPALVTLSAAPGTAISVGDYIRIESEILQVLVKTSTTVYLCSRARAGTTIAAHVQNSDVYVSDSVPTNISVPLVTTLTPLAFAVAFTAVFNNALSGIIRATTRSSTEYVSFTAYSLGSKGQVLLVANYPGVNVTACASSLSNSDTIANATFVGGSDPGVLATELAVHAITASEATIGEVHIVFPFVVREAIVQLRVTATGAPVAWDGKVMVGYAETTTEVLPGNVVTLQNAFVSSVAYHTPFDSTMTAYIYAVQ